MCSIDIDAKLWFNSNEAYFWEMDLCLFLFQGAALIYHKIWIIWHQHLFEVQEQILIAPKCIELSSLFCF